MKTPKAPDTSKQDKILEEQQAEETRELEGRKEAAKRKRKGRRSLLYGTEAGVTDNQNNLSDTLGG